MMSTDSDTDLRWPRYALSARQVKDIALRGQPLTLAMPLPPGQCDAMTFARAALLLPATLRAEVELVEREARVWCRPTDGGGGLDRTLGQIIERSKALYAIYAVVVRVTPGGGARLEPTALQWPGSVAPRREPTTGDGGPST